MATLVQIIAWHQSGDKPLSESVLVCHFDEIFITGCTKSCNFDNIQCSKWRKFHENDDISVLSAGRFVPKFFKVTSLAPGQSDDCPGASEETLKMTTNPPDDIITTNPCVYFMGYILLYKPVVESILTSSRNKPRSAVVSNVDLPVEMWHRATNFDSADEHYKQQNNYFPINAFSISF